MKKIKIVAALAVALCAGVCMARPGFRGGFHHGPPIHHGFRHHGFHHHRHGWGLAAGLVGGAVLGGLVYDSIVRPAPVVVAPTPVIAPAPVVVTQPVVTQPVVTQPVVTQPAYQTQNVWIEGQYVDQVQANGSVVRTWQPGHYEQRTVQVQ